jgi:BMFP domain-containing protein YqiC
MIDPKILDDLAQRLARAVPAGVLGLKTDIEENFRSILQSGLARLDLVPRQEFDVQAAVLRRTREMVEKLEARVAALEKSGTGPN